MSTVREQIQSSYADYAKSLALIATIEQVVEELGIADSEFYLTFQIRDTNYKTWEDMGPYIKLEPQHILGITATYQLVDTTPTLADAARVLMPKLGKMTKSFDGDRNKLSLTATFRGVRIILEDTPPKTCTVERIEEDVEVPETIVEAHTEKKVRYVLKGDCDPLMTHSESEAVPA